MCYTTVVNMILQSPRMGPIRSIGSALATITDVACPSCKARRERKKGTRGLRRVPTVKFEQLPLALCRALQPVTGTLTTVA